MTTTADAYQAGIDAVIADNTLNRGGFADALQTVLTARFTQAEATTWIDAIAAEYARLGVINNPTYNNLRGEIITEGSVTSRAMFEALAVTLNALDESVPAIQSAALLDLRDERDNINAAIDRCDALIAAEPGGTVGRLVKDVLRIGKGELRQHKQQLRDQIQNITGDPDA
jgi:hypothetical protein